MQYIKDYDQFIKNSPWYYRLSRYFFREQLFGKDIPQTPTFENEIKYLAEKQGTLSLFSQKKSRFVRWLVGLNLLIEKAATLKNLAVENQLHNRQKIGLRRELSTLRDNKLVTTGSADFIKPIEAHLTQQQDFINTIPKVSYQLMPSIFERFGRNKEIIAAARVSGGKPMTYANLIAEKKAAKDAIELARPIMIAKRRAAQNYHFYILAEGHPNFFISTHNSGNEDAGKQESDIIDGARCVVDQVNEKLKELSTTVPYVEIGEDSKPYVKIL